MNLDTVIARRQDKTVYRDGDAVIKLFGRVYDAASVLNEALNQARVEETALHVPKILEVTKLDGKWAIVSEFISGKSLKQLINEEPQNKDAYLQQMVELQMEVHRQKAPLLNRLKDGRLHNVLFCATGALMSPTSSQQGESIPGIAHLVRICS